MFVPAMLLPSAESASSLVDARLLAHVAVQVPAALARCHLPDAHDFRRSSLGWDEHHRAMLGHEVGGVRAGLRLPDLAWILVDRRHRIVASLTCEGHTLAQGLEWLATEVERLEAAVGPLTVGGWPQPDHPAVHGAPLRVGIPDHLEQLARWFAMADTYLQRLRASEPTAQVVRIWPRGFDLATTIPLDTGAAPAQARRITVGLSPGCDDVPEPHARVVPWPAPSGEAPELPVGAWHAGAWSGAVLRGSDAGQRPDLRLAAFYASGLAACRELLRA